MIMSWASGMRTGCCASSGSISRSSIPAAAGMAGSFGFEAGHHDVSVAVGERVLLPAVRHADPTTLIIADGFSCREQIAGLTDRGALHLAQLLQMALHEGPRFEGELPEMEYQPLGKWEPAITTALAFARVRERCWGLDWSAPRHNSPMGDPYESDETSAP